MFPHFPNNKEILDFDTLHPFLPFLGPLAMIGEFVRQVSGGLTVVRGRSLKVKSLLIVKGDSLSRHASKNGVKKKKKLMSSILVKDRKRKAEKEMLKSFFFQALDDEFT